METCYCGTHMRDTDKKEPLDTQHNTPREYPPSSSHDVAPLSDVYPDGHRVHGSVPSELKEYLGQSAGRTTTVK